MAMKTLTRVHWITIVAVVLGLLVLGGAVSLYVVQNQRIVNVLASDRAHQAQAASDAKDADARYSDLFTNYSNLYKQLGAHGVTPSAPPPSQVEQPVPGAPGATGATGTQGPGPTTTQIFDAVTSYCSVPGICLGPPGPTGAAGAAGSAGQSVTGPAGANGTDGTDGTNGLNGVDGRGITDVSCVAEADLSTALRFTFTDQTTEDVPASCIPPTQ